MARWKELPAGLDPRVRHLVEQLRRLKDASGYSVARVATRTGYSRSSWERYLAGRSLPPEEAVAAFARMCGVEPARLLALRDVAGDVWSPPGPAPAVTGGKTGGTDASGPPGPAGPGERIRPGGLLHGRAGRVGAAVCAAVLAAATAVLLTVRPWQDDPPAAAPHYTCRVVQDDGGWFAGLSRTRTAILQEGMAGQSVAEAQCLLRHADFSPREVDGIYGDLTQRAVRRLQAKHGLVTDGVVGPLTWGALRG